MTTPNAGQQSPLNETTPLSEVSSLSIATTSVRTKRPLPISPESIKESGNRRKATKVSRACDYCKLKKLKCTGTIPCDVCTKRYLDCQYDSQYRRGRPPTPAAVAPPTSDLDQSDEPNELLPREGRETHTITRQHDHSTSRATSRDPSGLEVSEIEGQIFDPTSNLTFIHRAWKRLAHQTRGTSTSVLTGAENLQPLMSAGDKPFTSRRDQDLMFVDPAASVRLFKFYFDNCVVTYRLLHQQYCYSWLEAVLQNVENGHPLDHGLGHAKAATVVNILAIAGLRHHKISGPLGGGTEASFAYEQSEQYFLAASDLTARETGLPRLESAQSRLLQVLYLLQTSRMNQAWYVFGNTVPIVSALGLHRKSPRQRNGGRQAVDYITSECRKRTFWVAYTMDKYLAVVFGRPRFYHDNDIDQDYPDRVNDEDMTSQGPSTCEPTMDCHIDSLIFHARIAGIIENVSREVYSLKKMRSKDRLACAQGFTRQLHDLRSDLPHHLGSVRPSSLIPIFCRQATALKLAYCHAVMHTTRPFLLDHSEESSSAMRDCVQECIGAAKLALLIVDRMYSERTALFHALWWMPYVTFCALAVVYVWEIQQQANNSGDNEDASLFALAERCQNHLSETISSESASRRYSIIIEELRQEATHGPSQASLQSQAGLTRQDETIVSDGSVQQSAGPMLDDLGSMFDHQEASSSTFQSAFNPLSQWQPTDWLDLDSSAFGFFSQLEETVIA